MKDKSRFWIIFLVVFVLVTGLDLYNSASKKNERGIASLPVKELKTIGVTIFEIGAEDGVWLELIKMIHIYDRLGYKVKILTGYNHSPTIHRNGKSFVEIPSEISGRKPLQIEFEVHNNLTSRFGEELEFFQTNFEPSMRMNRMATPEENQAIKARLDRMIGEMYEITQNWITSQGIDLLVSQNLNAMPVHLPFGVAVGKVIENNPQLLSIYHNHDFFWERGDRYSGTPYPYVRELLEQYFPGNFTNTIHLGINNHNIDVLNRRLGLDSSLLVNVMNFNDQNFAQIDQYNTHLFKDIQNDYLKIHGERMPDNALWLGQVTRIAERKNIEASITLLDKLQKMRGDGRVFLIITGLPAVGGGEKYKAKLDKMIADLGLEKQVVWAGNRIGPRREVADGIRHYSLSDFYAHLSKRGIMTYPSIYEGFGNAYVEALLAKTFIMVNNYQPVFPEIARLAWQGKEVHRIQMEDGKMTDDIANQVNEVLDMIDNDSPVLKSWVEHNFMVGKKHLSYDVAEKVIAYATRDAAKLKSDVVEYRLRPYHPCDPGLR